MRVKLKVHSLPCFGIFSELPGFSSFRKNLLQNSWWNCSGNTTAKYHLCIFIIFYILWSITRKDIMTNLCPSTTWGFRARRAEIEKRRFETSFLTGRLHWKTLCHVPGLPFYQNNPRRAYFLWFPCNSRPIVCKGYFHMLRLEGLPSGRVSLFAKRGLPPYPTETLCP